MHDYPTLIKPSKTEIANVACLSVLDAQADSKDTIMQVIYDIHKCYVEKQNEQWVLIMNSCSQ